MFVSRFDHSQLPVENQTSGAMTKLRQMLSFKGYLDETDLQHRRKRAKETVLDFRRLMSGGSRIRSRSDRKGFSANCSFQTRGVNSMTRFAGCQSIP